MIAPSPVANQTSSSTCIHPPQHKRVSFSETCKVEFMEPLCDRLTPPERNNVWYSTAEMESFAFDARRVCQQFRHAAGRQQQQGVDHGSLPKAPAAESLRGLEIRLSPRRQKRKYLTIQCVLMAQRQAHIKQEGLAQLAARCSQWAQDVAAVEGQRDFLLAYVSDSITDETLARYLPPLPAMTPFPVPLKNHHHHQQQQQQQKRPLWRSSGMTPVSSARNVRQRTSVC